MPVQKIVERKSPFNLNDMKITYKILWIDDELDSIEEDKRGIEDFLEKFGIQSDISIITNSEEQSIPGLVDDCINDPEIDILLVDYHMDDMDGAELISKIRNTDHVYLPVIFYSAYGIEDVRKAAYEARLDGVYIADRNHLIRKFGEVARSLLNKEHTTKRIRGLLMEEVSEMDAKFKDIYDYVWEELSEENRQALISYLKNIVVERVENAKDKLGKFPTDLEDFSGHMKRRFLSKLYDTYTRWRIVRKMLGYLDGDFSDDQEILKDFKRLLDERNTYAHSTIEELQEKHSKDECIKIRRDVRHQQDNIDRILRRINESS